MYNCLGDKKLSGNNILDLMHAGLLQVYKLQNRLYKLMPQLAYFLTFPLPSSLSQSSKFVKFLHFKPQTPINDAPIIVPNAVAIFSDRHPV
jgi:hypothetical protein